MTELLYYTNPDLHEFTAKIVAVNKSEKDYQLVLDRTAFYPEGGGQPADKGTIDGQPVEDVQKLDGLVYHHLDLNSSIPETGSTVRCSIDQAHRLDYMQQHSGQHIISAAMMKTSQIQTVSVRQGSEFTAIETSENEISDEVLSLIEDEANSYIRADAPINPYWSDADGLKNFNLRRPSKHSSNIRIIDIPGIDCVACGGLHLHSTAEAGLVKYIYQEKIRGNVRTFWKIGGRAYRDYAEKTIIINNLNVFYSARGFELPEKARAAAGQYAEMRLKYNKLEQELASVTASALLSAAAGVIIRVFENKSKEFITALLIALGSENETGASFIFNKTENGLTWGAAGNSSCSFDFDSFKSGFLPIIEGKGGGKAPVWQGIAKKPEGLEMLTEKIKKEYSSGRQPAT